MNTWTSDNKLPGSSGKADSRRYPSVPGSFFVSSRPDGTLSREEHHNYYETERGPLRMVLDFFPVRQQYKGGDWIRRGAAVYDAADISCFEDSRYTTLRENRSSQESVLLDSGLDFMDRRIFKTLTTRGRCDGSTLVIMAVTFVVQKDLALPGHRALHLV
ncbi:uncharacterized protein Z519_05227 [Cladophialophora bantiana CBS 173.52]|uniref:Uncharacterized protein n=1 Tax=Cladophialophora bantiana (strain ATCC 10958 / CBS 173.52 / CDC B-1940 / NIH 8579) TaxID=1442370 RepID=A0A0D2G5N3_CLAB1|nr:uncharacterized protein Z519_05227 [Cladophialophora bantiana CBS 173.52]KIW93912.1 hypothetical protein Z519_05227 [Cladophialophora bantiana CBS 173.52]